MVSVKSGHGVHSSLLYTHGCCKLYTAVASAHGCCKLCTAVASAHGYCKLHMAVASVHDRCKKVARVVLGSVQHSFRNEQRRHILSRREQYEQRTEQILAPILEAEGFELVDTEFVKEGGSYYLRAYIDKPGGITINDCEKVSRQLSDRLDEEDFVEESYILEVSSPGLGRQLKKDRDFARSVGQAVELRFYRPVNGVREAEGVLTAWDADTVTIAEGDEEFIIKRSDIALIRLAIDF